ncbi:MAG: DNA gyrase inhibitor YacG [Gemmataceae bacterium]|jgi:endogenous inhibitor of DNA gyrase (YacG/DUF329 family)
MGTNPVTRKCPVCNAEMPGPLAEWPALPFCSQKCKTIDLGRWLGERYRMPSGGRTESTESPSDSEE